MNGNNLKTGNPSPDLKNAKLHSLTESNGKNLLIQWGFKFTAFADSKEYRKLWEDKTYQPDLILEYKGKKAIINWLGKRHASWRIIKNEISCYEKLQEVLGCPLLICFAVFDRNNYFQYFRFAVAGVHKYVPINMRASDPVEIIEFEKELPEFTKPNILKYLS